MNAFLEKVSRHNQPIPCLFYPMAGKMRIPLAELLADGEKQKQVLVAIAETYPVGAVVRMTELWCEAAAFGMECHISENDFPQLGKPLFADVNELATVQVPQAVNTVTKPLIDAVRLAAPNLGKPLVVGATGPYTLGSVLCGSEDFMMHCMMEPDTVHPFLEKITAFLVEYIGIYKAAGAAAVMLAEPSTSMISPDMMVEFSNAYINKIVAPLQDDSFSVIYHNCGAVNKHLETIAALGVDAFHFGSDVDLGRAIACIGGGKVVMGNVDPRLFISGSPADIAKAADTLLAQYSALGQWRLSTGCDLSPSASLANIDAFLQASEKHSRP